MSANVFQAADGAVGANPDLQLDGAVQGPLVGSSRRTSLRSGSAASARLPSSATQSKIGRFPFLASPIIDPFREMNNGLQRTGNFTVRGRTVSSINGRVARGRSRQKRICPCIFLDLGLAGRGGEIA